MGWVLWVGCYGVGVYEVGIIGWVLWGRCVCGGIIGWVL